ncbi:LysR family transcriptional regulator [Stigmatella sp. ncwal1]|uniref:LysR family transcriptional regulator n=1 Tax=Stigmatella ashevillensis TaxID=2995309 RepID=A0ABT5CZW8_9BACT|nr:LysR family transcriptional regulator [Stigmatella ashevillena]MDC0706980.1 LysR family transcriptional regulator [Stigmatella ashevillena]
MFDAITLDQLRTFVAVVDEGSFSAAGRKLRRVQSAVSHAMANLETQLGVQLWDRSTKIPTLTEEGSVLLTAARRICSDVDAFKRTAEGLVGGLEPSISLAVDVILPTRALVDLCREFAVKFPTVQLRLYTDTLSAVSSLVLDGVCQIGVVGPAAQTQGLERQHISTVRLVPVAAKHHPLAQIQGPVATQVLSEYVNIVLSERGGTRPTADQGLLSTNVWRVADLHTKHAFLRAGLGWGNMPEHLVQEDLASGRLVRIRPAAWGEDNWLLSLSIVHRPDLSKGPATRWLLERMAELCLRDIGPPQLSP